MSNPQTSNAIVPFGNSNPAFAQQGALDWVALGRTQYSASIAILGRLAKAGIDTLTVAFGQAMCLKLPIGSHGEKVLAQAMSTLTAKSCAGDLLWFGVGVRHILRELVQTSQGCSLIALCGALTEGLSVSVSALVLYEIAKECGGPAELAPSLEQWEALVRVSASVFNATTFGLRMHQISRFSTNGGMPKCPPTPHPSDLAKVLLSVGQVVHGTLQTVSIQGDCSCSWVAAWADYVLGLRVLVRDTYGVVVYANYNIEETFAQVQVGFIRGRNHSSVVCIGSSHTLRSGKEFVRQCFGRHKLINSMSSDLYFCCGRLPWDSMFSGAFGDAFKSLIEGEFRPEMELFASRPKSKPPGELDTLAHTIFMRIVAISALLFSKASSLARNGEGPGHFIMRACKTVPELLPCKADLLTETKHLCMTFNHKGSIFEFPLELAGGLAEENSHCYHNLGRICGCSNCGSRTKRDYCLVSVTDTFTFIMFLLDRLVLESPLRPTVFGFQLLYHQSSSITGIDRRATHVYLNRLTLEDEDCAASFKPLAALFAGESWNADSRGHVAQSDGKMYCYIYLIEELTDEVGRAAMVHIGSGGIEYRTRLYQTLFDGSGESDTQLCYPAINTGLESDFDCLTTDTTSEQIEVEALIEERPSALHFRHHVKSSSGAAFIAPSKLLHSLKQAQAFKVYMRPLCALEWASVKDVHKCILFQGEGLIEEVVDGHILRPLRGNTLGRCLALHNANGHVAFVPTQTDIDLFLRYWLKELSLFQRPKYYELIS